MDSIVGSCVCPRQWVTDSRKETSLLQNQSIFHKLRIHIFMVQAPGWLFGCWPFLLVSQALANVILKLVHFIPMRTNGILWRCHHSICINAGATTLIITTFSIMTFSIMTFSLMLNKMQLCITTQHNNTQHTGRALLCWVTQISTLCWVSLC